MRFPSTMLAAFTGVAALLFALEELGDNEEPMVHVWMACQLGLALLTGIVALSESLAWNARQKWAAQGLGLALLALYVWYLSKHSIKNSEMVEMPRFMLLMIVVHLFVSVAPYLNRRSVADFWEYNRRLFANFVIGATFTMILFTGLSLAVVALDQLFDLNVNNLTYPRLFIVLAGIFNTAYFLYHFPDRYEFETEDASYNSVFRNLCKYILIPIVVLYFLILYAYGAKIVATWSLPRGFVGSLVIGFSVAGIFTYLLNFYLPEFDDSKIVTLYKKWFWPVLLPLTALLFAAIGKRIGDYGITEPRYIVLVTGIWLAAACVYFLFSKSDNLKFIPVSLAVSALAIAIGPLSAFSVSERSQTKLLQQLLEPAGRWENGKIKPGTTPMLQTDIARVESILDFFERREQLDAADWMPMPLASIPADELLYSNSQRITKWLGLQPSSMVSSTILSVNGNATTSTDIRGFTRHYPLQLSTYKKDPPASDYHFSLSANRKKLLWLQGSDMKSLPVDSFDLKPVLQKWRDQTTGFTLNLSATDATFELTSRKGQVRISVTDAQINNQQGSLELEFLTGDLFLKETAGKK